MNHDYQAQRADYLIKAEFPEIITTLYKISDFKYKLYVENPNHPLKLEDSIFEKLRQYHNDKTNYPIIKAFDINVLDRFLSLRNNSDKYINLIESIKFNDFERINHDQLISLLQDYQFKSFCSDYFNSNFRPVTVNMDIVENIPTNYMSILPPILDNQIVSGFKGVFLNMHKLINLLYSKFPSVLFGNISSIDRNRRIFIEIDSFSYTNRLNDIQSFLNGLASDIQYVLKDNKSLVKRNQIEIDLAKKDPFFNHSLDLISPFLTKSLEFEQRDEVEFFENLEKIYTGEFKKNQLTFYSQNNISCFLDFSYVMQNPINIRNYLLWYDKLYISPPVIDMWGTVIDKNLYSSTLNALYNEHKIDYSEILKLVKENRINFIIQQPLGRYDNGFLNEVFKINPSAIISRRAINTLLLIDIVEIFNNYPLSNSQFLKQIPELSYQIANLIKCSPSHIYNLMMWPIKSYRNSLELLTFNTHLRFSNIGINNAIQDSYIARFKKDLALEYSVVAPNLHIANALNATYFCSNSDFQDDFYALTMGDILNTFKTFGNVDEMSTPIFTSDNNPIKLFDISTFANISEINAVYNTFQTSTNGQPLLSELSKLKGEDLSNQIEYYNKAIKDNQTDANNLKWAWDIGYLGITSNTLITSSLSPQNAFLATFALGVAAMAKEKLLDTKIMQKYLSKAIFSYHGNNIIPKNTHFLNKISRVAKFKRIYS